MRGRWLLAQLMGRAAAERFSVSLAAGNRPDIEFRGLDSYGAWEAFAADLPKLLHAHKDRHEAFWRELERVVTKARAKPEDHVMTLERARLQSAVDTYAVEPKVATVWDDHIDSFVIFSEGFLFDIGRALDGKKYLALLGQLPHPVFVRQSVTKIEADSFPDLLRTAPSTVSANGHFVREGMVLFALLQAAADECRQKAWGGGQAPRPVPTSDETALGPARDDLEAFVSALLDALFSRDDAVAVGWIWLERLIFEGERRGVWWLDQAQTSGWVLDPLMVLVSTLSARLKPREDWRSWVSEREELWRIDRVAAVLSVAGAQTGGETGPPVKLLEDVFAELKPRYAGASGAMEPIDCVIGRIGAKCLLAAAEPDVLVADLWAKLRPTREQAWRGEYETRNEAAELLMLIAICAMERATAKLERKLWLAIRGVLEDAMQTDHPAGSSNFWPAAVKRHARITKKILSGDPSEDLNDIAEVMRPYIRADNLLFEMVSALRSGGAEGLMISAAIARWGVRLPDLAKRYLLMEKLRIERCHFAKPWLDNIQSLAQLDPDMAVEGTAALNR